MPGCGSAIIHQRRIAEEGRRQCSQRFSLLLPSELEQAPERFLIPLSPAGPLESMERLARCRVQERAVLDERERAWMEANIEKLRAKRRRKQAWHRGGCRHDVSGGNPSHRSPRRPESVEGLNRRAERTKGAAAPLPRWGGMPGASPASAGLCALSAGVMILRK